MSIKCKYCGRDYDTTLFEFDRSITCVCGKIVTFKHEQIKDKVSARKSKKEDREKLENDEEPV